MIVRKTLLAASALVLMSTPAWALPNQTPSNQTTGRAPSTTPAGPPATTPSNNSQNHSGANHHSPGDHPGKGTHPGSGSGSNQGPANHPGRPGHPNHPAHPGHPGHPGRPSKARKCSPHDVAYIASGTLVSQTFSESANGTYSGNVTIDVTRTNRHAASDQGTTATYTLTDARVTFDLRDINHNGSVGLDDLQTGDRVKAIGTITALAKKCSQSGFTPTITIRRIVFHMPAPRR
jgi:hypothetical protein